MNEGIQGSHALWLEVVNRIIGDRPRDTLLDVCCGGCAITRHLDFKKKIGVDVQDHPERPAEVEFIKKDAYQFLESNWGYKLADVSIISDGLEHLTKDEARKVLYLMGTVSGTSIIFVPTNDTEITPESENPDHHRSSWTAEEFSAMGYHVEDYPDWHKPRLILGGLFAWKFSP